LDLEQGMKRRLAIFCAAALVLLLPFGAALAATVTGITLPVGLMVEVGASIALDATVTPADSGATVTWRLGSSKYTTLTVTDADSCTITGKAPGRVSVTAKAGGKSATTYVIVNAVQASSIKLNAGSVTLNPTGNNSTYQLIATLSPTYNTDSVTWASDDTSVATVSDSGLVTAVSDGSSTATCNITATTVKGSLTAVCHVTVAKIPEKYVRVTQNPVVPLYGTRPLKATVYPLDAFSDFRTVTWSVVKNPLVASVDPVTGVVTGLKKGTAVIQASTANGRSARCTVTVKLVRYSSFSASPSSKVLEKGLTFQITPKRSPLYVSYPDVTYTSNNTDVATVDSTGLVSGVARGYAKISVAADKGRVTRTVTVRVIDSTTPTEVTISAMGDVMLGGDPRKSSYDRFAKLWSSHPHSYFFNEIKDYFKGITVANLEIPLIDTSSIMQGARSYIFRGKTAYADALTAGGIDAVDLDNNHILDYGSRGYSSTRSALTARGVGYFGLGKVFYKTVNGVKIGFMGFRPTSSSVSKVKSAVKAVKSQCDIVVVSFHWGTDFVYRISAQQIAYGHAAVQGGADLVLGHHSHVVSGIEVYKGKHIVYGLGSIVSTVELPDDTDTFIYRHTFSVTGTSVSNAGFDIVPVLMTNSNSYNDAQPVVATGSDKTRILNKIEKYSPSSNPF
jgi:poly-gamma-glutamate synthesis protein (capsule biosynthesis protein)